LLPAKRISWPSPAADGLAYTSHIGGVDPEDTMQKNTKKKEKCKNCEGKGLIKNGDKKMKCQRCGGTGFKS
jgi:hypothetical protein